MKVIIRSTIKGIILIKKTPNTKKILMTFFIAKQKQKKNNENIPLVSANAKSVFNILNIQVYKAALIPSVLAQERI